MKQNVSTAQSAHPLTWTLKQLNVRVLTLKPPAFALGNMLIAYQSLAD